MISVVVPVYNVERYLDECVQSIVKQTYKDFELILVDDGSTDDCGKMCDEYAESDPRIKVLHKKNGGLSDARNKGTEIALGTHVTYVDSDDFVSEDYLYTLVNLIQTYRVDIAVIGIERFYDGDIIKPNVEKAITKIFTGMEALLRVLYQDGMDTSACALLLPIEIAKKYSFPYKKFHEDEYTTYKYYLYASKVAWVASSKYFYRQRKGSIMHTFGQASLDELDAADNLVNSLSGLCEELERAAKSKKFSDYCQVLLSVENLKEKEPESFYRITSFLQREKWNMLKNSNVRIKNRIAALLLLCGITPLILVNKLISKRFVISSK